MAKSPEAFLLEKIKQSIETVDFEALVGTAFNIRHFRNRFANKTERPVISIRYLETEPNEQMGPMHTTDEECWIMKVELVVDVALPTESSALDPTGIDSLVLPAAYAFRVLRDEANGVLEFCDDVLDEGIGPDEDSSADEARLVQSVSVLYRTLVNDRMKLLASGENA